jgi:hypothetical protein
LAEALAVSQDARCKRGAGPYTFSTLFLASQRKDRFTVSPLHRISAGCRWLGQPARHNDFFTTFAP